MNKFIFCSIALLLLAACVGKHSSKAQQVEMGTPVKLTHHLPNLDTLFVDINKSKLYWKGTKLQGTSKHEGEIQLASAYFLQKEGQITGGEFRGDMRSISVTDIPANDSIPIKNINQHLKSKDFFEVETYPFSTFSMSEIRQLDKTNLEVSGNLTLKGISKHIQFKALMQDSLFSTVFTFDRFQWNIAYEEITDKTVIDKEVELRIELKIK